MLRSLFATLFFAAAGCAAAPAPPAPVPPSRLTEPRLDVAREYVELLVARRFAEAAGWGDSRIRAVLPAPRLESAWNKATDGAGGFLRIGERHGAKKGRLDVAWLACDFQKGTLVITVELDASARVVRLWFGPLESTWSAPPYADRGAISERDLEVGPGPKLAATLTVPKGAARSPVAVLVHGSGPSDRDESDGGNKVFKDIAWGLASRGVAVLRYEKRTHEYPGSLSKTATYDEEVVNDARAVLRDAAAIPEVDPSKVFLIGHSLGAALAPRIASGMTGVAGMVLLAGPTRRVDDLLAYQIDYLGKVRGLSSRAIQAGIQREMAIFAEVRKPGPPDEEFVLLGATLSRAYLVGELDYDAARAAAESTLPMLVLQGGRDYQVTAAADYAGYQRALAGKPNVTMKLYPGLNHHLVFGTAPSVPAEYKTPGHVDGQLISDIATWMSKGSL